MLHINMIFHVRDYHFRSHKLHYITMGKVIYLPTEWNDGINAAFINYTYRQNKYWYRDQKDSDNIFLGLRSGINLGAWRVRNHSTYNKNSDNAAEWNSLQTYVERDIRRLKSRLTLGETASSNDVLESVPYRGIKLASDESMLPTKVSVALLLL